jgi:hypothetical protein
LAFEEFSVTYVPKPFRKPTCAHELFVTFDVAPPDAALVPPLSQVGYFFIEESPQALRRALIFVS